MTLSRKQVISKGKHLSFARVVFTKTMLVLGKKKLLSNKYIKLAEIICSRILHGVEVEESVL